MKRNIIMLCIFGLVVGLAVVDVMFTTRFYNRTLDNLYAADISIEQNIENINNCQTVALANKANDDWEKGKRHLMMLVNHNVVRYVDEKFVSLLTQVESNNYIDAIVSSKTLISYIKDLKEENHPYLRNIL